MPGRVFKGKVRLVLDAIAAGWSRHGLAPIRAARVPGPRSSSPSCATTSPEICKASARKDDLDPIVAHRTIEDCLARRKDEPITPQAHA